ncbi:MAG: hypothetical protein K5697_03245 [Lachnospiraceae bacterium]|nr:hypothetical protein [Lachnospiraceae bacterium]
MSSPDSTEKNKIRKEYLRLAGCGVFYLVFCFVFGIYLGSDSRGYIEMISAREPVYPLFLLLWRSIFGEGIYLWVVIILQNLLMAFCVWYSCEHLWKRFSKSRLVLAGMYAVHAGVAVLCQFLAERGAIYSSNILTEGITVSLWLLAMTLLIEGVLDWDRKKLLWLLLLLALLTDTRKQMAVGYPALAAAVFFGRMGKDGFKLWLKRLLICVAGIVLSLILALGVTRLYNYVLRGSFAANTRDMNLVLTTTLYVADPEDASLIGEEAVRTLFERTMKELMAKGSNYSFAEAGWSALEAHYEENFDRITVDTTGPLFVEYAKERGFKEGMEAEGEADRMSLVIVKSLFFHNLGRYLKVYGASLLNGLINTVAKRHPLLDIYGLAACLLLTILVICCLRVRETREAGRGGLFVLFGLFCNTAVAAALIFCQSRYMIYNMALFYMAFLWTGEAVISSLLSARKKTQTVEKKDEIRI